MTLNDFQFNSGIGFAWFSQFIDQAIVETNKNPDCKIVANTCTKWNPASDCFEWDTGANTISYGRWYHYEGQIKKVSNSRQDFDFWLGLILDKSGQSDSIQFSFCFDSSRSAQIGQFLNNLSAVNAIYAPSTASAKTGHIIVSMTDTLFGNFCAAAKSCQENQGSLNLLIEFLKGIFG